MQCTQDIHVHIVCVGMYMKVRHQCSHSLMCVNMHVHYMYTVYIPACTHLVSNEAAGCQEDSGKPYLHNYICMLLNTNPIESQLNTINY